MAKDMFRVAVIAAASWMLVACGGGGDSGDGTAQAGSATGVLTDSPVQGVEYTTSGGFTGLTDENGNYRYNPGETVTFKIGGITLGTVEASDTVTPLELSGGDANVATNLLVLFQSLDADGNAANGITITAAAREAADDAADLDLAAPPATFASAGNEALVALMEAADTANTAPVSPDEALAHFKQQFMKSLRGGWIAVGADRNIVVLRFEESGRYIMGETGLPGEGGQAGIENGVMDWAPATGVVTADVDLDGNGEWGLSHLGNDTTFRVDGDQLIVQEGSDEHVFTRMGNTSATIIGMWSLGATGPDIGAQTFVFLQNGTYMMLDPVGDDRVPVSCPGYVGLEVGKYAIEGGHLKVTQKPAIDQNRCAGLWDSDANGGAGSGIDAPIEISADGLTMTVGGAEGATLYRVRR